jgi:dTDP-4-amino-4,6-dideoxygalactose transaminase
LPIRKHIALKYIDLLSKHDWAELPIVSEENKETCYHLFPLRIKNISEVQRDAIIQKIFDQDVSVNVHFIPVPKMSFYTNLGYNLSHYPVAADNFIREISLPIFVDLTDEQIVIVVNAVVNAVNQVIG